MRIRDYYHPGIYNYVGADLRNCISVDRGIWILIISQLMSGLD